MDAVQTDFSPLWFLLRVIGAAATAFCVGLLGTWLHLRLARSRLIEQPIRKLGPKTHQAKAGTPTLGGLPLVLAAALATLAWTDSGEAVPWYLASLFAFAAIGFLDDLIKIRRGDSGGLGVYVKLAAQFAAAIGLLVALQTLGASDRGAFVPFVGETGPWSPLLWYIGSALLLIFISNAVNLSDGLDGLVSVPVLLVALGLGILGVLSDPLLFGGLSDALPELPGSRGALLFAAALGGALLSFLWFNAPPARLFMGDTGSLALGGALGMLGILLNQQFLLLVMSAVFVLEALSVCIQVGWFKWSGGQRVFRMAPLHHDLELRGWPETRITLRFWIATAVLTMLALGAAFVTVTMQ